MPHSGRTSKGRNYPSTSAHPAPRGSRATGTTKSAAGRARRPAMPSMPAKPAMPGKPMMTGQEMAASRNKMQQGTAMRNPKAAGKGKK